MPWQRYDVKNQIEITAFHSLFEHHFPNDWDFEGESHDFWECVYVIRGDIFASGDGKVFNLSEGEIIFHRPMEFHRLWLDNKDGADVLIFSFSTSGAFMDFFCGKVFCLSEKERNILSDMLEFMKSEHKNKKHNKLPMELTYLAPLGKKDGYLQRIAVFVYMLLFSLYESPNTAKAEETQDSKVFSKAVKFMKDNITKQISVEEIAKHTNTSTSTLKRIFAKYMGVPIHKYFNNLKISRATELLQSGKNVTETAEILG
ncbi:MAG: helix-turn-helix domain-containing protein, partial [Firmicutes bacterium]|nr:helix-turn-helix domain-containing protein [Bacillota bacterium]